MKKYPEYNYDIRRVIADGHMVAVHSLAKTNPGDRASRSSTCFTLGAASLSSIGTSYNRSDPGDREQQKRDVLKTYGTFVP
jgi:hypothetical protein